MEIGYTPNYSESFIAGHAAARNAFHFWQRYWCFPIYLILGGAIGTSFGWSLNYVDDFVGGTTAFAVAAAGSLVIFVIGVGLIRSIARRLTARWIRQRRAERPTLFSVEPDGLQWKAGQSVSKLGFSDIDQIFEAGPLIGFLVAGSAPFVPKRAFSSPEQCREFIKNVFEHLSEEAKQRSMGQKSIRLAVS